VENSVTTTAYPLCPNKKTPHHELSRLDHNNLAEIDPVNDEPNPFRVKRGGAWLRHARQARSAARAGDDPGSRDRDLGFRLARTIP